MQMKICYFIFIQQNTLYWVLELCTRRFFLRKSCAKIRSNRNIIYGFMGLTRSFDIDSEGLYELEGSGNIVYSGMGWSPNNKPLIGSQNPAVGGGKTITDTYNTGMVPSIKFTAPPKSYGDNNIILYLVI